MFRERMVQRIKRDVVDQLYADTFQDEFGVKSSLYLRNAEESQGLESTKKLVADYYKGIQIVKGENPEYKETKPDENLVAQN